MSVGTMERYAHPLVLLVCVWTALLLLLCNRSVHGQTCARPSSPEPYSSNAQATTSTCPVFLEGIDSLLNGSTVARNCHRWTFENATARNKVTLGVLFPIYNLNASAENKCSDFHGLLGLQLVEALRLALREGLERSDRQHLREILGAVEIRDTCFSPRFGVEQAVSLAVSSPQAALYCRGNWSQQAYLTLMDDDAEENAYTPPCNETNRIPVIIGPGLSSTTKVVAPTLSIFKIPHITYWATSDAFTKKREYPYLFRTVPSDKHQAKAMVALLAEHNWTYVIALSSNDEISGGLGLDAFRHAMAQQKMCIAFEERFHYSDNVKIKQIVEKLAKEPKAKAVMLFAGPRYAKELFAKMTSMYEDCVNGTNAIETSGNFCEQMDKKHFVWIASDGWIARGPSFIYKNGSAEPKMGGNHTLLGFVFKVPNKFWNQSESFTERLKVHLQNVRLTNENLKFNPWLGPWAKCGQRPCKGTFSLLTSQGVIPPIASGSLWLAVEAALHMIGSVFDCQNCSGQPGSILRAAMQNTTASCQNNSSCTVFQNTDLEKQDVEPGYLIMNAVWHNDSKVKQVSLETVGEWGMDKNPHLTMKAAISWAAGLLNDKPDSVCAKPCEQGESKLDMDSIDGISRSSRCCWKCQRCKDTNTISPRINESCTPCEPGKQPNSSYTGCKPIPPTYIHYSEPAAVAIVTVATVGMFVVLATAVIFHVKRATQVVHSTSQALNNLLLLSLFVGFVSCLVFFNRPSTTWCSVMSLLATVVINFSTVTVLVRTLRLAQTTDNEDQERQHIRCMSCINVSLFRGQLLFISLMTALPLVIFTVWVIIDPVKTDLHISDTTTVYLECERKWVFNSTTAFFLVALIATTAVMAFQTRKLPSDYNEAKLLLFTAFALCVLWIALTPPFFVTDRVLEPVIIALTIVAHMLAIWFCLFLPRLYIIILRPQRNPTVVEPPRSEPDVKKTARVFSFSSSHKKQDAAGSVKMGNGQVKRETPSSSRSTESMCLENHANGKLSLSKETSL